MTEWFVIASGFISAFTEVKVILCGKNIAEYVEVLMVSRCWEDNSHLKADIRYESFCHQILRQNL